MRTLKKRILSLALALLMAVSLLVGCGGDTSAPDSQSGGPTPSTSQNQPTPADSQTAKESPMLADMVAAGTLPALEERLPSSADAFVDAAYTPADETPVYGGTMRTPNAGMWYFGPICEEPLFRLLDDGSVEANVAGGYDLSDDGLVYTIHLREGMKWSDGTPFTATDCVYYYNYVLVTDVDNETGKVTKSNTTKIYNWYMTADPSDGGKMKPAQVRYVDDVTFTITLYSPKPTLLQNICIDNKWMFCPREWYKDIMSNDASKPHWSGETDLKLIGGEGLPTVTEEQALANAKARSSLYTFEDYNRLCEQLGYRYWQYAGRPTLRPWNITSALTEQTLVFERNPYYWKVDAQGRQLPYVDKIEFVTMDESLNTQEVMAGNLDFCGFGGPDFPTYKASEATGCYSIKTMVSPNWTTAALQLNQSYKDAQYAKLFAEIDFRHALSIAADRSDMNEILNNGMAEPQQFAAPEGTAEYIPGAPEKWIELDVDEANRLLDGISMLNSTLNADGYRTFADEANAGKAVTLEVETTGDDWSARTVALLAQYYKKIGIQVVEVANTDNNARNEKYYTGNQAMCSLEGGTGVFNVILRPDYLSARRNNVCWLGKYGLEHQDHLTPEPGTPMAEVVDATLALNAGTTMEELQAAGERILQSHYENTWAIGFYNDSNSFYAVNNRIHNWREGFVMCDELRFLGNGRPYTWFIQE
jgi:peptide/nickel transport system substrate-binding protein